MASSKAEERNSWETSHSEEFRQLLNEFRETMVKKCKPLPDEPNFYTSDAILTDCLRARKYKLDAAVKMLYEEVEWRRSYQPLKADCHYCHEQPGFHCIRQIGHDKLGRPIFYACFAQTPATKYHSTDVIVHCVQMLENARLSMKNSATQVVYIIDCTGITLQVCNPNLGKKVMHIFADYYPELLGSAVIVNHKAIFKSIWKAMRKFLDPITAGKVMFLKQGRSSSSSGNQSNLLSEGLRSFCDDSTARWLETEIQLNKEINETQMRFWDKPASDVHDPRGTEAFVKEFIDCKCAPNGFLPHPNIVDIASGKLAKGYPIKLRNSKGSSDLKKIDAKQMQEYGIDSVAGDDDEEEEF